MNLENKLKEFEKSCFGLATNDVEKLKTEIEQEIESQIKKEIEEYIQRKDWNFKKTIENLEKSYMKEIFNFQNDCKKEILNEKKQIYKELKQDIINKINDFSNTSEYKNYLLNSIKETICYVNNNDEIILGITSKDLQKYRNDIMKINDYKIEEIDNKYLGGCIVKSNSIYIDNTLLNSIEEKMID